jgi:hypothetical protein
MESISKYKPKKGNVIKLKKYLEGRVKPNKIIEKIGYTK